MVQDTLLVRARIFATIQTGPVAHPPSCTIGIRSLYPGVMQLRHGVDHPSPCGAEIKEGIEVDFYSFSGPSWPVLR